MTWVDRLRADHPALKEGVGLDCLIALVIVGKLSVGGADRVACRFESKIVRDHENFDGAGI